MAHRAQVVAASRPSEADVIITGSSSQIARTPVTIGVDLTEMNTVGNPDAQR